MGYQPTFSSLLTEITVSITFLFALLNAWGQGRRWFSTVFWGALAGYGAEYAIVHSANPRYSYGTHLFWAAPLDVPICIGLGWGVVFYAATWTAQRLRIKSIATSSLIAGVLGANIDLSLDPVAQLHGFWSWAPPRPPFSLASTLFGVPFDNFVAWVALIGVYGFVVRTAFRRINRARYGADKGLPGGATLNPVPVSGRGLFLDLVVPPLAAGGAGLIFVLVRNKAALVYELVGRHNAPVGEAIVFGVIFVVGFFAFWTHVLRSARNDEVNGVVLLIPFYIHLLSLFLLINKVFTDDISGVTPLLVLLPLNLVAGMVSYAWPSIDTIFDRYRSGTDDALPLMQYMTLSSYAGKRARALVCKPRSQSELCAALAYARAANKDVTFRAGGQSFDTQALNDQIVISLERLNAIGEIVEREPGSFTITVGAGATWGKILAATLPRGFAPHVMVTSSSATAGGTLSSNSLARFSASSGREGRYVESFRLLTPDGNIRDCSRSKEPTLFHAVIGGLGYVGAVLEVTYWLLELPAPNAHVETEFTLIEGLERIATSIRPPGAGRFTEFVSCFQKAIPNGTHAAGQPPVALSAVVYLRGGAWGLVARSRYVEPRRLEPSIFHAPNSPLHLLLQLLATIPFLRWVGYSLTFKLYRQPKVHVDKAFGYTFFEDGNRKLRRLLHFLGVPGRILQQTFIIPAGPGRGVAALDAFLKEADQYLDAQNLEPALIDVLYVDRDADAFVLSSSRGLDGFAVTFTFERLFRSMAAEERALKYLSSLCGQHNGRVHLVKNVCADPELIEKMYPGAFIAMRSIRETNGAHALRNEFSRRVLPGIELEGRRA